MSKYKIIAICGKSASGKDTLLHEIIKHNKEVHEIISCTTRPPRQGEQHGVNYYFYTLKEFEEKVNNNEMLEHTVFNNWCYGTSIESLKEDSVNVGVFNPAGVRSLLARDDCDVLVFRVCANDKTRLLRQLNREANPDVREVVRRFQADYDDFDNIEFRTIPLPNDYKDDLMWNTREILNQTQRKFFPRTKLIN